MSAKEEVGESLALVVYNGTASRINDIGLQLYPVSKYDSGEGLPYALVDWPNFIDKWGWRTGKRATNLDTVKVDICIFQSIFKHRKMERKIPFELDDSFKAAAKLKR